MSVNSQETSNQQSYYNDALSAEVTVTTSAQTAENQSGGMRVNAIPKDGGNIASGSVFFGGTDGNWQSDNVSDYLKTQNFTSANGIVAHPELQRLARRAGEEGQDLVLHRRRGTSRPTRTWRTRREFIVAPERRLHPQHARPVHPRRAGAA